MKPLIELDLILTDPEVRACPKVPVTLRLYCRPGKPGEDIRERMTEAYTTISVNGGNEWWDNDKFDTLTDWAIERYIALGGDE